MWSKASTKVRSRNVLGYSKSRVEFKNPSNIPKHRGERWPLADIFDCKFGDIKIQIQATKASKTSKAVHN